MRNTLILALLGFALLLTFGLATNSLSPSPGQYAQLSGITDGTGNSYTPEDNHIPVNTGGTTNDTSSESTSGSSGSFNIDDYVNTYTPPPKPEPSTKHLKHNRCHNNGWHHRFTGT